MDGALEFIQQIKKEIINSRIFIITNGATINATGRIKSTGLDKYIDGLFVSEDMGVSKPSAEYFDLVLRKIAEPKETCIVIGDSLTSDMLGAKKCRACFCLVYATERYRNRNSNEDIRYQFLCIIF